MKKAILLLSISIICCGLYAQRTEVFTPHIRTVQVIANHDYTVPAIIQTERDESLEISFDHLTHEYHRYQYILTHCNTDWTPSDLSETEYLDGFNDNPVEDYEISVNTTLPYTHYRLTLPNDQVRLKLSGNYRLTVYDDAEGSNKPAFSTCFRILEKKVNVSAQVSSDTEIDRNKTHQQVSFGIQYKGYPIRNPQNEIKVYVLQNGRTDNQVTNLYPSYIGPDQLRYEHNRALIFAAGNEYRRFEMVSTRYASQGVEGIRYHAPYYHVSLYPNEPRLLNYSYDQDQNGRFVIRYNEAVDNNTEADYFFVHFSLLWENPLESGDFYLQGAFTHDNFNAGSRLEYNAETHAYESTQLLKQGAYNYQYLYVAPGSTKGSTAQAEGNFYETENEYLILVYQRAFGERYDRLIGMQQVSYK
ncbi:DUF5103 domain-containing protein [Bacteroides sp. UBA939]|uniref:type IX secretion system plug protein n=1 Tax=Bacteroides sp. UBA939 TaxID=1946092 RepID=UPI0025B9DCC4|nr:DUF5103 domain-containing protein [Bacteroides sp. UBA939]